jgi:hypothetical protein
MTATRLARKLGLDGNPLRRRTDKAVFEIICRDCGDQPSLDYREVSPQLQRTRGPFPIAAGVTAYENHLRLHRPPARHTSPGWHA